MSQPFKPFDFDDFSPDVKEVLLSLGWDNNEFFQYHDKAVVTVEAPLSLSQIKRLASLEQLICVNRGADFSELDITIRITIPATGE